MAVVEQIVIFSNAYLVPHNFGTLNCSVYKIKYNIIGTYTIYIIHSTLIVFYNKIIVT